MALLEFLLAALLDPVQAALVLAAVLVYRGPVPVLVAAAAAAVASETIMTLAAADYAWGEVIVPRLVSSLAQAGVLWWIVGLVRSSVWPKVWPKSWSSRGAAPRAASSALRLAPWHMRALVRRGFIRLR